MDLADAATGLYLKKLGDGASGLDPDDVSAALGNLLGDQSGNIDLGTIIGRLDVDGLSEIAESWLGDGANSRISARQIASLFGEVNVERFANRLMLDRSAATGGLVAMLPELIDGSSRGGKLLDTFAGAGASTAGTAAGRKPGA